MGKKPRVSTCHPPAKPAWSMGMYEFVSRQKAKGISRQSTQQRYRFYQAASKYHERFGNPLPESLWITCWQVAEKELT